MNGVRWTSLLLASSLALVTETLEAQRTTFGGDFEALAPPQQHLIEDWAQRFNDVTGQDVETANLYNDLVRFSTKTTFDAVTHALMTTTLSDASGESLGTALDLVESVEAIRGKMKGASGDRQFRMYVRLVENAVDTLNDSTEFERGADNTVYHKGYPMNYRQQGGVPSIQISIARDRRRADIDVDYRSSSFPVALFNGHLSASNSDVRAGNNGERHNGRWDGLINWWNGFLGIRVRSDDDDSVGDESLQFSSTPRIGDQTIEKMMHDFLTAWLIEGNVAQAMGYVSERALACVALEREEDIDVGMAPYIFMMGMRAARDALGSPERLEDLVLGVNLANPALRLVRQPHHSQFVLYSIPDDVAAEFDCASRLELEDARSRPPREYGNYFGATFFVQTPAGKGSTVALLWAREGRYWKIVSYEIEPMKDDPFEALYVPPDAEVTTIPENQELAAAVDEFLTSWFIDKDYDDAFAFVSPRSYPCYNLYRDESAPEATSNEEAGRLLRGAIERAGELAGRRAALDSLLASVEPTHPIVRLMTHPASDTYALTGLPNAIADLADCSTRARDQSIPDDIPLDYGDTYGAMFRFRTRSGETPIFRTVWAKEDEAWKIISYDVAEP